MKESSFRTAVLSKLPAYVHRQPNLASFASFPGTPDTYLDYQKDLWVEFKFIHATRVPQIIPEKSMPTEAQIEWLNRRWHAGGNALVVVGIKLGARSYGFILNNPAEWSNRLLVDENFICSRLVIPQGIASTLLARLTGDL